MRYFQSMLLLFSCAFGCIEPEKPISKAHHVTEYPPPTAPASVDSMLAYALTLEDTLYVISYPRIKDVSISCNGQEVTRVRNLPLPQETEVNIFTSKANELIYEGEDNEIRLLYLCTYVCSGQNKTSLFFVYYGKVGQRALLSTSFNGKFTGNIPKDATIEVNEMSTDRVVSRILDKK